MLIEGRPRLAEVFARLAMAFRIPRDDIIAWFFATVALWLACGASMPRGFWQSPGLLPAASLAGIAAILLTLTRRIDPHGSRWATVVPGLALTFGWLWIVRCQALTAIGYAMFDERHFLLQAQSLVRMKWLGPYDQFQLMKGIGYPAFVAGAYRLGLPLLMAQHLVYAMTTLVLAVALRPLMPRRWAVLVCMALVLFNPMNASNFATRAIRDYLYAAECLLVFAGLIGVATRWNAAPAVLARWSALLGVAFTSAWLTREETVWLAPSIGLVFGYIAVVQLHARANWRQCAILAVPIPIWAVVVGGVSTMNKIKYGVFATCELRGGPFVDAYAAMSRVEPAKFQQYVPVARETRQRLYEVSSALKQLAPILDGEAALGWEQCSQQMVRDFPAGEVAGGWFIWSFRNAAAATGHFRSGKESQRYFKAVAAEINSACDSGRLAAGPRRSNLAPPWRSEYLPLVSASIWEVTRAIACFKGCNPVEAPTDGSDDDLKIFRTMTRERLASSPPTPLEDRPRSVRARMAILSIVGRSYHYAIPWAVGAALGCFVGAIVAGVVRRKLPLTVVLATAVLGALAARVCLIAYINVSSFKCVWPGYFSPAYPLMLLFIVVAPAALVAALSRERSGA